MVNWTYLATHTPKVMVSIWINFWGLPGKESNLPYKFYMRYCKDIAHLLFWVLWKCLAMHTQSDIINLQKNFVSICRIKKNHLQKINFIPHVFRQILQRYAKILFLVLCAWLTMYIQNDTLLLSWDITFWRFLKFDWPTVFWPIARESEFWQT